MIHALLTFARRRPWTFCFDLLGLLGVGVICVAGYLLLKGIGI